ncbi:hypothetical protein [Rhodococcus sp. ARC_M6]|uniref:hypothetical protein n=1 Tax=Rhodococcus sp. ARC_M6 TaxID=2928852 RepID=UPI001FB37046|nr:hypothetical protein [Rhodococcus sp. ARC_M6]MCJ0906096.1 hypothetical protein [Rhodococcus sp. ARC_M6]
MEARASKTFIVLWDGSDEGYDPDKFAEDVRLTALGYSVTTDWSFGRGYGDPEPGDRIFLHRTGNENGIIASGQILSSGVEFHPHWSEPEKMAPYVTAEWEVLIDQSDRLPYAQMKSTLTDFKFPVQSSGREVYSPSDQMLESMWEDHVGKLALRDGNPWLGGSFTRAGGRKSGPCALERHRVASYDVAGFTSTTAVKTESELVSRFADYLTALNYKVQGYRILPEGTTRPLFVDIHDVSNNHLYEAKASASREAVRMALGQLLDYRRGFDLRPELSVLLPERPVDDLLKLLAENGVGCTYETSSGVFETA